MLYFVCACVCVNFFQLRNEQIIAARTAKLLRILIALNFHNADCTNSKTLSEDYNRICNVTTI